MTKLINLRVSLAVDDAVDIKDVKPRLANIIVERGTEAISEDGGRVHWCTAEVLQGPDRVPQRKSGKRGAAAGQSELLNVA